MHNSLESTFRHWFAFDRSQTGFGLGEWYVVQSEAALTDLQREKLKQIIQSQFAGEAIWTTDRRIQIFLGEVVTARQTLSLIDGLENLFNYSAGQPEDGKTLDGEVWTVKRKLDISDFLTFKSIAGYSINGKPARLKLSYRLRTSGRLLRSIPNNALNACKMILALAAKYSWHHNATTSQVPRVDF
jgi:hypothetical protein